MMTEFDEDGSGSIDFRELVGMLAVREQAKVAEHEIVEAFRVLSKQGGGARVVRIGRECITEALESCGLEELEHDPRKTEDVVTSMLRWMNGAESSDTVKIEVFREKMLSLGGMMPATVAAESWEQLVEAGESVANPAASGFTVVV